VSLVRDLIDTCAPSASWSSWAPSSPEDSSSVSSGRAPRRPPGGGGLLGPTGSVSVATGSVRTACPAVGPEGSATAQPAGWPGCGRLGVGRPDRRSSRPASRGRRRRWRPGGRSRRCRRCRTSRGHRRW
jgi:hypothetical protein